MHSQHEFFLLAVRFGGVLDADELVGVSFRMRSGNQLSALLNNSLVNLYAPKLLLTVATDLPAASAVQGEELAETWNEKQPWFDSDDYIAIGKPFASQQNFGSG